VHGHGQRAEDFPGGGSHHGRADENTTGGVLDEFDQSFVAVLVDPFAGGAGHRGGADADVETTVASGVFGQSDGADLGVGERHPRQRTVVRRRTGLAQDVADDDAGPVHRDGGERAVAGDIPDAHTLSVTRQRSSTGNARA